eukprot:g480.t1
MGIGNATDVVIGGGSAGALAVYLHADYYRSRIDPQHKKKFVAVPDCGFFMDSNGVGPTKSGGYHDGIAWLYSPDGMNAVVDQNCRAAHAANPELCLFAAHLSPFIQTPVFALQAKYDAWQIPEILRSADRALINQFGANLTALLNASLLRNRPSNGAFVDGCEHHCGGYNTYHINNLTQAKALLAWYNNGNGIKRMEKMALGLSNRLQVEALANKLETIKAEQARAALEIAVQRKVDLMQRQIDQKESEHRQQLEHERRERQALEARMLAEMQRTAMQTMQQQIGQLTRRLEAQSVPTALSNMLSSQPKPAYLTLPQNFEAEQVNEARISAKRAAVEDMQRKLQADRQVTEQWRKEMADKEAELVRQEAVLQHALEAQKEALEAERLR